MDLKERWALVFRRVQLNVYSFLKKDLNLNVKQVTIYIANAIAVKNHKILK